MHHSTEPDLSVPLSTRTACIAFFLLTPLLATAQEPSRHSIEIAAVGRQTANQLDYSHYSPQGYPRIEQLFGGVLAGYSYSLTPRLALEARGGYLFGHQPQIDQGGGEQIMAHLGLRATLPLGQSRFALRARVAPGIASFTSGLRSQDITYTYVGGIGHPESILHYGRITHFSLEQGVGLSTRLSRRTYLNFDVSHEIMLDGDRSQILPDIADQRFVLEQAYVEDHALVTVGISRFFGRAFRTDPKPPSQKSSGPAPSNELILSYVLQPTIQLYHQDLKNEQGVALTGSHFLTHWLALDSSILYLPRGDTPSVQDGGSQLQFFSGAKFGIQRERYGVYAKFRPGLISISHVASSDGAGRIADNFAGDLGAVVEFYPARQFVLRFDLGETLIRYSAVKVPDPGIPGFGAVDNYFPPLHAAAGQFLIGAGWRF